MNGDLLDLTIKLEKLLDLIFGDTKRKVANENGTSVSLIARKVGASIVRSIWRASNCVVGSGTIWGAHACNGDQLPQVVVTESL
jgi:hypothetical protein